MLPHPGPGRARHGNLTLEVTAPAGGIVRPSKTQS